MKKYKNIIIAALAAVLILAVSYFYTDAPQNKTTVETDNAYKSAVNTDKAEPAVPNACETAPEEETPEKAREEKAAEETKTPPAPAPKEEKAPAVQPPENGKETPPKKTEHTCTISVRCDTLLNNLDLLTPEKRAVVPENGIILSEREVVFNEGESAFDVLLRELRQNKIHMEFNRTPVYKSAYIEGIANIYEFDCGALSGWMFKVNGAFPSYGCSRVFLSDGDRIEWVYSCDFGEDVGAHFESGGGQRDE